MSTESMKRPVLLWVIFGILVFEFISAVPYGLMLTIDPTEGLADMPVEVLKETIFNDFRIPGLILLIVIGFGSSIMAFLLLRLPGWSWVWTASIYYGLAVMIWITVQVIMIGFDSFLQSLHFCIGVVIIILLFMPSMRRYLLSKRF